ncbi:MAG: histidine kinase [Campylobacterales bacterium]|nr:histidine kinase [Campylobacterales bacterium]
MYNIALHIKVRDWLYILLIGIIFGTLLSTLGYALFELSLVDGAIFGFVLGFDITLFSLMFISNMNRYVLPNLREIYWLPLSMLFSFLSGFLGTILGVVTAKLLGIELIWAFVDTLFIVACAIGILTYIVGALLYRFVKMRNEKELIDSAYVESRLRSLETQLNPHFLFNALNSIAELIHHNPEKAEMAVLKVSTFLRNTMNETALLSLRDEIRNVKDYVDLENIRFSGKIVLHIDEDIPSWHIPKFSLQLLVENAIKHGFLSSNSVLNIFIEFQKEERKIDIRNDGEPMTKRKFGVGLSNLKQRLELLCKGDIVVLDEHEPTFSILLGECCESTNC